MTLGTERQPLVTIPFRARGLDGRLLVDCQPNDDPVASGHDLVAVGYDRDSFRGFPVVTAHVEFIGTGYRAIFGWIQVVSHVYAGGDEPNQVAVDRHPAFDGTNPMFPFGYLPTFFDAPANPDHDDMRWQAETFLTYLGSQPQSIVACAGFTWGHELTNGRPRCLPVEPIGARSWDVRLDTLTAAASPWTFLPGFDQEHSSLP